MVTRGWIAGILGLWLVIAAFLALDVHTQETDDLIVGLIVAIIGLTMFRNSRILGWSILLLGIWVFIAAFFPSLVEGSGLFWNNILIGGLIALAGFTAIRYGKREC
jgi:hypothetical protein